MSDDEAAAACIQAFVRRRWWGFFVVPTRSYTDHTADREPFVQYMEVDVLATSASHATKIVLRWMNTHNNQRPLPAYEHADAWDVDITVVETARSRWPSPSRALVCRRSVAGL